MMDQTDGVEQRKRSRRKVLLSASLEFCDTIVPVRLRDLSVEGALVEGDNLPEVGCTVIFRRGQIWERAEIVWASEQAAGIQFANPIAETAVLRSIGRGSGNRYRR